MNYHFVVEQKGNRRILSEIPGYWRCGFGSNLVDRFLEGGHDVTVIEGSSTGRPENLARQRSNKNLCLVIKSISAK